MRISTAISVTLILSLSKDESVPHAIRSHRRQPASKGGPSGDEEDEDMAELKPGDRAPQFELPADGGGRVRLSDYAGVHLVLYFYPKDDTTGCTAEAQAFNERLAAFEAAGTRVLGLSKDSPKRHDAFKKKYGLNFPLASDETGEVLEAYGVWVEKSLYGRKYMGVERATFLIDPVGAIRQVWRKVKVPGHAEAVLEAARSHGASS
jgi:peroxiredoxin Q/BCP